ncbi:MAG: L,D-transpeptidase family protein [Nocardioidaceae bacterium]
MQRIAGVLLAAVLGMATLAITPVTASATHDGWLTKRFARELVRFGERDRSTYDIEHVRELQWRLKRERLYRFRPNGRYGTATRAGVRRFQRRHDLRVSGNANEATWRVLLKKSNKNRRTARRRCSGPGWHICYDRRNHQVTLWRAGTLWNSWLVRGGSSSNKTRTGNFTVFRRERRHRSSLYGSPMPYSQFFSGGQAFHGSRAMMNPYDGHSHGCVNMYVEDARQLWSLTHDRRLRVHVYGRWS